MSASVKFGHRPSGLQIINREIPSLPWLIARGGRLVSRHLVTVTAAGSSARGAMAHFNLLVDGRIVGQSTTTTAAHDYGFAVDLADSTRHKIAVQFDND